MTNKLRLTEAIGSVPKLFKDNYPGFILAGVTHLLDGFTFIYRVDGACHTVWSKILMY